MAKARAIVKRRTSVKNIRKITQTMQLIATARYQKCMQRAVASQPYTEKITEMIQTLGGQSAADHPLLEANEAPPRSQMLVISANRGLCGPYNGGVLRKAQEARQDLLARHIEPALEVVGKKGIGYLNFLGIEHTASFTDIEDRIEFARVSDMAERFMQMYLNNEVQRVDIVYMRFVSVGVQRPTVAQLLPIQPEAPEEGAAEPDAASTTTTEFEYSPEPATLLAHLIPEAVKIRLFQCFNDAIVSEQVARMVAMKAATDAAGDMIKFLTRQYNRARQTQITTELADIVGGANAVQ
jgi:F-type H+-transporting ATPase subunit gamma